MWGNPFTGVTGQWTRLSVETTNWGNTGSDGLGAHLTEQFPFTLSELYPVILASYASTVHG